MTTTPVHSGYEAASLGALERADLDSRFAPAIDGGADAVAAQDSSTRGLLAYYAAHRGQASS